MSSETAHARRWPLRTPRDSSIRASPASATRAVASSGTARGKTRRMKSIRSRMGGVTAETTSIRPATKRMPAEIRRVRR